MDCCCGRPGADCYWTIDWTLGMNEQPINPQQPPQPPTPQQPIPTPTPPPIAPGYQGQPVGPPPDPAMYQAPSVPISSSAPKPPILLFVGIGAAFLAAVGLLIAVFVLM